MQKKYKNYKNTNICKKIQIKNTKKTKYTTKNTEIYYRKIYNK